VALPVLSKVRPNGGPTTVRLVKRLECSSAVSSRLSDTAQSHAEQEDRQTYLLTVDQFLFTVNINFIDAKVNHINQAKYFSQ